MCTLDAGRVGEGACEHVERVGNTISRCDRGLREVRMEELDGVGDDYAFG